MDREKVGISAMINLGNQIDLCESDFIEYFVDDEDTNVIGVYLEGPKDKEKFRDCLQKAAAKKPIVLFKPGSTEAGTKAASSHTGSIAGNDVIFTHACRQYGAVRCDKTGEFINTIYSFALCKPPQGSRVALLTTSGGVGSIAVDELYKRGIHIADWPDEAKEDIRRQTGITVTPSGMFDINIFDHDGWANTIRLLTERYSDNYDILLFVIADGACNIERMAGYARGLTEKPVMAVYLTDGIYKEEAVEYMRNEKIAYFDTPEQAAESLSNMLWYYARRRSLGEQHNPNAGAGGSQITGTV